jgi:hypothetical protein
VEKVKEKNQLKEMEHKGEQDLWKIQLTERFPRYVTYSWLLLD